jgi:hypothetical protein
MLREQVESEARKACVFVDAHVHIHDCFDIDRFFDGAAHNFNVLARELAACEARFVLCLTETLGANKFRLMAQRAESGARNGNLTSDSWQFLAGSDDRCLRASHPRHRDIEVVAGRQVVTSEKLEVLVLGTLAEPDDGLPAATVIEDALQSGAIPVLPWGFGKWLGRRRNVVRSLIRQFAGSSLYLGDNSGRSVVLPTPPEFRLAEKHGLRILPGSDPLPFESECNRGGSFGFRVDDVPVTEGAWANLSTMLQQGAGDLRCFGSLESPIRFVRNQIAMNLLTRIAKRRGKA